MTNQTRKAYISMGSNVGDRGRYLTEALRQMSATKGIEIRQVAPVYETEPVGVRDQPWFLNTVIEVATNLDPEDLLHVVKEIERSVGRTPRYRWGPREIDLDILIYEGVNISIEDLTIPHPRMRDRLFVLLPLKALAPDWRDEDGTHIDRLIERARGTAEVRPYHEQLGD